MASFKDRMQRRRERRERRKQEMLDRGLEAFEASNAGLIGELRKVGHDPSIDPRWIETGHAPGGWQFTLACRKCGLQHRAWVPKRLRGLSPDLPCTGTGPTFDQWVRDGLEGAAEPPEEGTEHTVVEVRARSVAEATETAIRQLGLPADEVDVRVVTEGERGVAGLGRAQAIVWARPKN